mmetsp:Transcript_16373/g.33357  ORF Transcript_16373/g.33357 Transcript_16373/m.33357 type:complete len:87 (-) Transcript_16373:18-278(-)
MFWGQLVYHRKLFELSKRCQVAFRLLVLRNSTMAKKRKKTEKALGPGTLKQSSAGAGLGWSTRLGGIDDQFAFGGLQGDGGVPKSY